MPSRAHGHGAREGQDAWSRDRQQPLPCRIGPRQAGCGRHNELRSGTAEISSV